MAELGPENIARPSLANDPGVRKRATTVQFTPAVDPTGQAVSNFANDLLKVSAVWENLFQKKQDAEDRAFVDRYQLELTKRITAAETEALNSPDVKRPDFVNAFDKRLEEIQKETYDQLTGEAGQFAPSQRGREAAMHSAMTLRRSAAQRTVVAAHNQRVSSLANSVSENALEIARAAGATGDLLGGLERAEASIKALSGIVAPDKYEAFLKASKEQVFESVVRGHIERGNFDAARRLIDKNRGFAENTIERRIADASSKKGIDPSYLVAVGRIESDLNPMAKATKGTARGLFQFVAETASEYGLGKDASAATEEEQIEAAVKFTAANQSHLKKVLGRNPTNTELYLAHFLGAGDAEKVLKADPNTPLNGLIRKKSIDNNESILSGKTVGDVIDWANRRMVQAGGGDSLQYMKESTRVNLLQTIETRQHQLEERQLRLVDRRLKEIGEAYMKEAFKRGDEGTLTYDYVNQIKTFISPTEYKGLLARLRGGDESVVDDVNVVIELTDMIDIADPDTFMEQAANAVRNGKLKTTTFSALVQKNRAAFRDDTPSSPFKAGRELVRSALDPGQMLSGAAAQAARISMGRALEEFDNFILANPKADRATVIAEANNIIRRAQLIDFNNMKLSTNLSRYFTSVSRMGVTLEDVKQARRKLFVDIESGKLTKAQQESEIRLLKQWEEILTQEANAPKKQVK